MDLSFEIAGDQIDGAREYQEDAFLTTYIDDESGGDPRSVALVIMADGMGGHAAGNIASNLVVSTFNKSFTSGFGQSPPSELLRESLSKANAALRESIRETPALDGMGCTMVTAIFSQGKVYWVSVGDSHLYLIRNRELFKQNADHSYGGYLDRMKAQGVDVEAEAGLSRNMLMSAMTGDDIAEIDCPPEGFPLLPGDRIVVASDGLDTVSPGTLIQTSAWSNSAKECVQALLKAVDEEKKPRQDNTTVIVVDVGGRDAESAPAVQPEPATVPEEEVTLAADMRAPADPPPASHPASGAAEPGHQRSRWAKVLPVLAVVFLGIGGAAALYYLSEDAPKDPPLAAASPSDGQADESRQDTSEDTARVDAGSPPTAAASGATGPVVASSETDDQMKPESLSPVEAVPDGPVAPVEFSDPLGSQNSGPVMVSVPAGTFEMGSSSASVAAEERPRHTVEVAAFAIGKFEITFAQYELFARATGRRVPDNLSLDKDRHPVLFVSWDDALAYTQWLSQQTGQRYRLPSEAEWEYAASGGTSGTPYWWGFDRPDNNAHCFDCRTGLNPRQATSIGRFEPNQFGLYDTAGNVFEWVHDCYHPNYEGAPATAQVWEGGDCAFRVARGGGFTSTAKSIRVQKRHKFKSQGVFDSVGFRVARDL